MHAQWTVAGSSGEPLLAGTVVDITNDRVAAPPAELQDRYRLLVELSPDAICVHCAGDIVFVNRAGLELMGAKSPEDLIGKPIFGFVVAGIATRPAAADRRNE